MCLLFDIEMRYYKLYYQVILCQYMCTFDAGKYFIIFSDDFIQLIASFINHRDSINILTSFQVG